MDNIRFVHGGNIHRFRREMLDFSANINPLGIVSSIKKEIYRGFAQALHYPDPQAQSLTARIARYWGIEKENILVGNGSVELIYLIVGSFMPAKICIPVPSFSEYERAAVLAKSKPIFVRLKPEEQFHFNSSAINPCDMLIAANPNNPSGNILIENSGPKAKLIVVDEAFMDFLPQERKLTFINQAGVNKKIIVLRTFTKFFALPGLRLGYAVAHKDIIKKLKQNQIPWTVNSFAQIAGEKVLDQKDYISKSRLFIEKEREFLSGRLNKIKGITVFPSLANFLLLKIENKKPDSVSLQKELVKKNVIIRDCSNFRGLNNRYIRIAVRTRKENRQLLKCLEEIL